MTDYEIWRIKASARFKTLPQFSGTTSSGILKLECPSLEAVLRCMEARHMAGWFAPHMTTAMELRTVLGEKDALLTALHETR